MSGTPEQWARFDNLIWVGHTRNCAIGMAWDDKSCECGRDKR